MKHESRLNRRSLLLGTSAAATAMLVNGSKSVTAAELPPGRILFAAKGSIYVWEQGDAERLIKGPDTSSPRWSPNGSRVVYVQTGNSFSDLHVRNLEDQSTRQVTFNQPDFDIGSIEYAANTIWAFDPAWGANGLIAFASDAYTPGSTMALFLIEDLDDGAYLAPSTGDVGDLNGVTLDAEGTTVGYSVRFRDDATNDTYVALRDLVDGTEYRIANDLEHCFDPAIAPNGDDIALCSRDEAGMIDIWLANRLGDASVRLTTNSQATRPCWSPDGKWLAYLRMVNYNFQIWAMPIDGRAGGEPLRLHSQSGIDATGGLSWTLSD